MAFELLFCYFILCSKYWCIMPIGNHACSEASKLIRIVWPHKLSRSRPKYAGFTLLTGVDMLIISVYTQPEQCWIKYRTISRTVHNFYYCYYHDWMCKAGLSDSYAYLLHVDLWCSDLLWPVILLLQMSYVGQTPDDKINLYLDVTMVVRCTMMFMNLMPDNHLVHT